MFTKTEVLDALSSVKHPAINYSLIDLGIIKDVEVDSTKAKVIFSFPFPNIPIKELLVKSTAKPINALGLEFVYEIRIMNEEEKNKFLSKETKGWRI